jgi:membrane fusion protein (multidrug efflux system)
MAGIIFLLPACSPKDQPSAGPPPPPEVLVAEVTQRDVPVTEEWVGSLDGSANVQIHARVQGYLVKQDYKEGMVVKAGDPLFEIDPRPFEAALAQANADLAKAQAQQTTAELTEKRQTQLFASKNVSEQDRDVAVQNNIAAKATVGAAKAAVDQAQLNLGFCKITSPVDGIAGIARPGIGDLVGPGSDALTTVSTVNPIKASFQLSEQGYMKVADKVNAAASGGATQARPASLELILADGSVHSQKGKISAVNRQVDVRTGTIQIDSLFPNPDNLLRPGQFARVRAVTSTKKDALLVPQRAVAELQGNYQIAVITPEGNAEIRPVQAGERVDPMWLIDKGLKPGEKVVVDGFQKVREGMPVNAKPWTPPVPAAAQPQAQPAEAK